MAALNRQTTDGLSEKKNTFFDIIGFKHIKGQFANKSRLHT